MPILSILSRCYNSHILFLIVKPIAIYMINFHIYGRIHYTAMQRKTYYFFVDINPPKCIECLFTFSCIPFELIEIIEIFIVNQCDFSLG